MSDFFSYAGAAEPEGTPVQRAILAELSSEDWEKFIGHAARRRADHPSRDCRLALC